MRYDLANLLDLFLSEVAVALYMSDGLAPVFAIPAKLRDVSESSVTLYLVEGPILKREELELIIKEIGASVGNGGYQGLGDFRYRKDSYDFDVFLFVTDQHINIEFRHSADQTGKTP